MYPRAGTYAAPSAAFGYYRGAPLYTPSGGIGMPSGPIQQGLGVMSQGQGAPGSSGWHPTIIYLLGLVIVETILFGFLVRKVGR
jgi:hypothetical protein